MRNKNKLGLFSLTMIVIGLVIGMGIFRTSKDAAQAALTPELFFGAWIVGGLVAFCGALTYAEIGSRYPVTGGYYKIFSYAYHPSIAFAINCIILISNAASLSGVALIGSEYITPIILPGASNFVQSLVAMAAIVLFYGVNLMGLRMSSQTQNVLMLIKIAMLIVLIAALFFPVLYNTAPQPVPDLDTVSFGTILLSFGVALKATSFTYGGYQQTINFGDEIERPQRNIPRGIFIGILVIISLYMTVSFAYYKVIGFNELKETSGIAAIIAEKMFGPTGKYVSSILLFVAVLAYVNVLLLSNPRVMYAMSEDGILPAAFRKKDEKRDVLTVSLTAFAAICIVVLFFAEQFNQILSFTIFLDSIGMATSAATIFILRKRTKHLDGTGIYTMKLYPVMPVIFIIAYLFVGTVIAITDPMYAVIGVSVFVAFLLLYFATQSFRKKSA
ncbi:MAG: APC family permease [Chitinophagaceae bacterium]|jgi:APA family basic amino acid/polyamine antiporter|nr:APC family permease [Chitinophagaceae bacterium]